MELNNDKAPYKKLVELSYNLNESNNKEEIIMRVTYSLTGHFQRKNAKYFK